MKLFHFLFCLFFIIITGITCKKGGSSDPATAGADTDTTVNAVVYVTGNSGNYNAWGNINALNAKDGSVIWSTRLYTNTNYNGIHSSPTLVDGTLYFGCPPNNVYAIDAKTGDSKWRAALSSGTSTFFYCAPLVANNTVFIGNGNKFYALDAATGVAKWTYTSTGSFDESSPCIYNNVVYANCTNSPNEGLYGFDAATGAVKLPGYVVPLKYSSISSPCVYNNNIYNAATNDAYGSGFVYALNSNNYSPFPANFYLSQTGKSSPTIFNGILYIGSSLYLYAYDITDTHPLKWQFQAASALGSSSPTTDGNRVYIGSAGGVLYAINASDGTKAWELNANGGSTTSPTLANGIIYYGSPQGLFAVRAETGKLMWENSTLGNVYSSPCVISKTGEIFHSSISGIKN